MFGRIRRAAEEAARKAAEEAARVAAEAKAAAEAAAQKAAEEAARVAAEAKAAAEKLVETGQNVVEAGQNIVETGKDTVEDAASDLGSLPELLAFNEAVALFDAQNQNCENVGSSDDFAVPDISEYTAPDWSGSEEVGCTAEIEVQDLGAVGAGYSCKPLQLTIGTAYTQKEEYPFPSLYHNASSDVQAQRDAELNQAKIDNWFDDVRIPGAWVHGNVGSPDVLENMVWTLRGTPEARAARGREHHMGVNDADVGEDATDVFEAAIRYFQKNIWLFIRYPSFLAKMTALIRLFVENAFDDDLFRVKFQFIDPILAAVPQVNTKNIEDWNFYPDCMEESYPKQPFDSEFRNDDVVAWLQVAYATPYSRLKPLRSPQSNFKVTNNMFKAIDGFQNDDLNDAMADGRVFVTDFKEYHKANTNPGPHNGAHFYAGIAMFAVPKNGGDLKTIAIQPTQHTPKNRIERTAWRTLNLQDPDKPLSEILTPKSNHWAWQQTKLAFMSMYAISNVIDHLSTHVYLYPLPISLYRNIPNHHPLTALLEPHMMSLVANNHAGIFSEVGFPDPLHMGYGDGTTGLLSGLPSRVSGWTGETFVEETVRQAGTYDFVRDSTPLNRNSDTQFQKIAEFPLHDDEGTLPIIRQWVDDYVRLYYDSDADVLMDHEVQSFCAELEDKVAGFPGELGSKEELVDMLARVIYWMSTNHTLEALLSCQKFAPFGYFSNWLPRKNSKRTEQDYLNTLPPLNYALASFCGSRIFVDLPTDWHRSLGKYPHGQFMHDPRVYPHLENFQRRLLALDEGIKDKNKNRRWEYSLMRPSTMTCSPWN